MASIPRRQYAALYGPTTGDRLRLADTTLLLGVERDLRARRAARADPVILYRVRRGWAGMGATPRHA